jgi:leucyl aminopeptidase
MKFAYKELSKRITESGVLVVFGTEGARPELPTGVRVPAQALSDFKGGFREARLTDAVSGGAKRVLLVGLGKESEVNLEKLRRVAALGVKTVEQAACASATLFASKRLAKRAGSLEALGVALAEGATMGPYRYTDGKTKPRPVKLKSVTITGTGAELKRGVKRGRSLGEANCFTRDLQNKPGNQMTPRDMAAAARKLAARSPKITCRVLDEKGMEKLGMGLLLGVSQGSSQPARFIHLTYKPKAKAKRKVAVVGKGLTFDAGGVSIKPSGKMDEMRYDMSGGGAVLGLFHALGDVDVPVEVHGIVPSTENVINGQATKPGDIHKSMDGQTVEVLNTDAEGRLILADALAYTVSKIKPNTIIDMATLTGAVVVALGHELSGMFATTDKLRDALLASGERTGEKVWPLPLLDHHKEQMRGVVADLRNIAPGDMGAGSSAGAAFLSHFAGDGEWCHLDIAGTAWGGTARDWVGGGQGAGVGVRLLMDYLHG